MWKGKARTEDKSTGEKPLHNTGRVPCCQSLRKPSSSGVNQTVGKMWGLALQSRVIYHGGELGSLTGHYWRIGQNDPLLWRTVLGFVGCSAAPLSSKLRLITSTQHKWIFTRIKWLSFIQRFEDLHIGDHYQVIPRVFQKKGERLIILKVKRAQS